jgi:guanylate kinase
LNQKTAKQGKVIIFSAPSGAGKTSIVRSLLERINALEFSISACSRAPRTNEVNGKDYFFMKAEEFKENIKQEHFLEWEEVYENHFYGTLKSELNRIWADSKVVIFDVDVKGGISIKKQLGDVALSIFVMPPSINELENRLRRRKTETEEKIQQRITKATVELEDSKHFDLVLNNDILEHAIDEAESIILKFIAK